MHKRLSSRTGLFLLELIISILFFCVASAVCIQLFVASHTTDRKSRNLTKAVKCCEDFAEVFTAAYGNVAAIQDFMAPTVIQEDIFSYYYDKNWSPCTGTVAEYVMIADFGQKPIESSQVVIGNMNTCHIAMYECYYYNKDPDCEPIYEFDLSVYDSDREVPGQ